MSHLDVSVIIPTFREAENLPVLIPKLHEALEGAGLRSEIVIVDDNSPDATRAVCEELAKSHPVRLIVRTEERGLSSAVICGMRAATGEFLQVMDADLSHPAEKIPELIAALRGGSDFVIGSRYVPGGATEEGWGVLRWLNSKVATLLAYPLTSAKDPMAGFFALRRETFESAERLDPIGYKIGLELIVKCRCRNVGEVPIFFRDRLHGESKLSLREQLNYLRHLKRLYEFRMGRAARPIQFLLVGGSGMVIDLACFGLLLGALSVNLARALAIWVAMSWNFWLNRRLTFSYARKESAVRQYVLFCASCLVGALVNWFVSVRLVSEMPFFERWKLLAAVCGVVAGTVFNYVLSSKVVFRGRS